MFNWLEKLFFNDEQLFKDFKRCKDCKHFSGAWIFFEFEKCLCEKNIKGYGRSLVRQSFSECGPCARWFEPKDNKKSIKK